MATRSVAGLAVAALIVLVAPVPASAAPGGCDPPPPTGKIIRAMPYEDQLYDLARLGSLATGKGVRVAVLDSGVDDAHPQLSGRVVAGADPLHGTTTGRVDCRGHGTEVASIIAARPVSGVAFHGLAPGAVIVPVRVSEAEKINGEEQGESGTARELADAIRWSVNQGRADVINLSLTTNVASPAVERAVEYAIDKGVVVVAAVGNDAVRGAPPNPRPYPACYPGVIGVGWVRPDGLRAPDSQFGDYVDLMAVGSEVTVAAPGRGHRTDNGTSFATPFVAATAALVLERFPGITPAEVARRLIATADPAPGGRRSAEYGNGLLNPYRALTETVGSDRAVSREPAAVRVEDPVVVALRTRRDRARVRALVAAGVGAGLVVVVGLTAAALRRGRRRGWRPGQVG
jgi:type VII secretion-associated serine protease mycosin